MVRRRSAAVRVSYSLGRVGAAAGKAMLSVSGETALTATAEAASRVCAPLAPTVTTWVCKSGLALNRAASIGGPNTTVME